MPSPPPPPLLAQELRPDSPTGADDEYPPDAFAIQPDPFPSEAHTLYDEETIVVPRTFPPSLLR